MTTLSDGPLKVTVRIPKYGAYTTARHMAYGLIIRPVVSTIATANPGHGPDCGQGAPGVIGGFAFRPAPNCALRHLPINSVTVFSLAVQESCTYGPPVGFLGAGAFEAGEGVGHLVEVPTTGVLANLVAGLARAAEDAPPHGGTSRLPLTVLSPAVESPLRTSWPRAPRVVRATYSPRRITPAILTAFGRRRVCTAERPTI